MILIAAAAKSAQLPFSSWLPRAMEGPTPSSAIFYGSLSVHIGAFLLLRTFPFWENQTSIRMLIILLGGLTALLSSGMARVQSSIKSQIAYSSIVQIGIIFIEISLGYENLALFHFAGNAFLRTYQLLVSPSVVTYLIREQFYNFEPRVDTIEDSIPRKLQNTLYLLSLKEWSLDELMYRYLWAPVKWIGKKLNFLTLRSLIISFLGMYIVGLALLVWDKLPPYWEGRLAIVFGFIAVTMVLKSFTERKNPQVAWFLIIMNHFWIALAVSFNELFNVGQVLIYLSGVMASGLIGSLILHRLAREEKEVSLDKFQGHSYAHPKLALLFLLCCLGLTGFPISSTFIGEDLVFTHIHENQIILATFASISFIVDGLSIMRIYARIFLGPHINTLHEMGNRSS
jgi:formate hydrogenlyase subunit 3/multisubunit Na+/H+ antiporter MnhD subunit